MVIKKLTRLGAGRADQNRQVIVRALEAHGLEEYRETGIELERLRAELADTTSSLQRRRLDEDIYRHECRQDALRSAAVILGSRLGEIGIATYYPAFDITKKDEAKVASGITNPHQCPAHDLARFLVEQAESDFIKGRVSFEAAGSP